MKKLYFLLISIVFCFSGFGAEIISFQLSDGEKVLGKLDLPEQQKEVPMVVVFVHGTGPNTYLNKRKIGDKEFNYFDLFVQEFNKRGIGFFTYNRRGVEMGEEPPYFQTIDSARYAKYLPHTEAEDIESMIQQLKKDSRLKNSKIALLGASEGTILASLVAERKVIAVDALLLFGYANESMYDIIKWQYSGKASIINLRKYFDADSNDIITRNEYYSTDEGATIGRNSLLQNTDFSVLDVTSDSILDYKDFGARASEFYELLLTMVAERNDSWIWNNFFNITSQWLINHFQLEANKTRLLRVDIPIYIFHGTDDGNVPVEGVYDIENRFKALNKTNLHCFVFKGHNHDLNYLEWPFNDAISEGLASIFSTAEMLVE